MAILSIWLIEGEQLSVTDEKMCSEYWLTAKVKPTKEKFVEKKQIFVLTLCLPVTSADNFGKQFGPRSGPTNRRAWSGSKLFAILMVFLKEFFQKINFEKISRRQKSTENYPVCNELINWAATGENRIFAYEKTKTQSKLIRAFVFTTWIVQYLSFLNPKFQISSYNEWLCSWFVLGLVRNPEDPFSDIVAQLVNQSFVFCLQKRKQDDKKPLEEKIKTLKKRNAELAAIARRLEEKAKHLQQENLKVIISLMSKL